MRYITLIILFLASLGLLVIQGRPSSTWSQDVYVWQQTWRPSLRAAVREASSLVDHWRVLAGVVDARGAFHVVTIDGQFLSASQRPVVLVVRLDGQRPPAASQQLALVVGLLRSWRELGISVMGVEIDHDCATARLSDYGQFLRRLRMALPSDVRLSITALPSWMESNRLPELLDLVEETVLQVHAVADPRQGLMNPATALAWTHRFARYGRPFKVSIPTYGSSAVFSESGRLLAVESENRSILPLANAREMMASPLAAEKLIRSLRSSGIANLQGIVWFRLPTSDDSRSWSMDTMKVLLQEQKVRTGWQLHAEPEPQANLYRIAIVAAGNVDQLTPKSVFVGGNCTVGDGIAGYLFRPSGVDRHQFIRHISGLLAPGQRLEIGWLRCTSPPHLYIEEQDHA